MFPRPGNAIARLTPFVSVVSSGVHQMQYDRHVASCHDIIKDQGYVPQRQSSVDKEQDCGLILHERSEIVPSARPFLNGCPPPD